MVPRRSPSEPISEWVDPDRTAELNKQSKEDRHRADLSNLSQDEERLIVRRNAQSVSVNVT